MDMHHDNGILARIRGEDIAKGSNSLPRAGAGQPEQMKVEIDTPGSGRVRITYYLNRHKRGKSHYWFWAAHHAEPVEPASPQSP